MEGFGSRVLGWAITLVVVALLVHWAYDLLRPVLPFLAGVASAAVIVGLLVHYRRNRHW